MAVHAHPSPWAVTQAATEAVDKAWREREQGATLFNPLNHPQVKRLLGKS